MKQIRIFATLLFVVMLSSVATAQFVSPVDFMRNNPRAAFANPAFYTADYGYFDFALGGINIGAQNIGLKYDKFFRFNGNGQPTTVDLNAGVASLRDVNYLNTYVNVDIFNCGRRTKYGYFTYTHRFREVESLRYNKDMVQLLANGNSAFLGESNPADINIGLSARAFQEFDFGYQMSLLEELNIGVRLKFLMGFMDAKTQALNVKLYTDPETYALKLMSAANVNASLPVEIVNDENGNIRLKDNHFNPATLFKNYGLGIDLGAEYKFDDHWGAAAALNDLGFIRWKTYAINFSGELQDNGSFYDDGAFVFPGLTAEQVNDIVNTPGYVNGLVDSLRGYFQLQNQNLVGYTTGLYTNLMLRGYYDLTPEHRFSAQFTGFNVGLGMKPAMTLAYTGSFNERYDVVATYTMMPGGFDNLGLGLSANLGGMLIYFATNNLFGFFNPANRSMVNAQFGISFTSGDKISRSETIVLRDHAAEAEAEYEAGSETGDEIESKAGTESEE